MRCGMVMLPDPIKVDNLEICDRRRDVRIIVDIPGRYSLADHWDAHGKRRKFSCRAVNISRNAIALAAPVIGTLGKRVVADIEELGRIEGFIVRALAGGFAMSIAASEEERLKLLDKIEWLEKQKNIEVPDRRAHARFVPIIPYSTLAFADGTRRNCLVIDLSEAGAQIAADIEPAIGTVLAVGTLVGRVVRSFRSGFGVKFIDVQSEDTVETKVLVSDCLNRVTRLTGR